jgi:hypothetical protein
MGVRTRGLDIKAGAAKLKADKAARLEAELVIDRWNRRLATGRDMLWSPTIRAALVAGTPWLDVFCPAAGRAERSTCGPSTGTHWPRSARWCWACGAHGVRDRRRCRSCWDFTRCRQPLIEASLYKDVRPRPKSTAICMSRRRGWKPAIASRRDTTSRSVPLSKG